MHGSAHSLSPAQCVSHVARCGARNRYRSVYSALRAVLRPCNCCLKWSTMVKLSCRPSCRLKDFRKLRVTIDRSYSSSLIRRRDTSRVLTVD